MWQLGLSCLVACAALGMYLRVVREPDSSGPGIALWAVRTRPEPPPHVPWVKLSRALYASLKAPDASTVADRGTRFVALASPRDTRVLAADRRLFVLDVNRLIAMDHDAVARARASIDIINVIADADIPDGEPRLTTLAGAHLYELRRRVRANEG